VRIEAMSMVMSRKPDAPEPSDYEAGGKPLTGWKVLAIFVGFFMTVFIVDGVMAFKAVRTFSGEVTPHPYERGVAYNKEIAEGRAQAARDWKVDAHVTRTGPREAAIEVVARDAAGAPVAGVEVTALFAAPATLSQDVRATLVETAPGRYSGKAALPPGQRDLVLTAAREGRELFRSKNRIDVE
jgi:nitrogen fixation protein FixH